MGTMNRGAVQLSVIAIFSLIFCSVNGAGKREGEIAWFANVHPSADMHYKSHVGSHSVVGANVKLHRRSSVGAHCYIQENVEIQRKAIILEHCHIEQDAIIGSDTVCEQHTSVGKLAVISNDAILKQHARVERQAKIGPFTHIGHHASIGRHAELDEYVYVAQHAHVASNVYLAAYVIVEQFVVIPPKMQIGLRQVVISSPETNALMRMLQGRKLSSRFISTAASFVQLSDKRFALQMSYEIGYILNHLNDECKRPANFIPQLKLLAYAYLAKMHGFNKVNDLIRPITPIDKNNPGGVNDCMEAKRFDRFFDKETVTKFLMMLALYEDFQRPTRRRGEEFCTISMDLLSGRRSVLAINEKCGGTITAKCSNGSCLGLQSATGTKYWMTKSDIYH